MKRTLLVFSLLALLLTGFSAVQAQNANTLASPAKSGMTQFDAYRMNFNAAVNQGNVEMASPHRAKLVNFMEREIAAYEAASTALGAATNAPANVVRSKEILDTFKNMDLSTVDALQAAKTKLTLIDEFGKLTNQKTADTN